MFKKLDSLVIRTFLGPFLFTTLVALIALILQFFWKYLDDMAGKGLEIWVIIKLTIYLSATVVPLSLPIGVLFASLFTFGNMGEKYELVAIKASGISFFRFMRPILILSVIISAIAFIFANNVVPYCTNKFNKLLYNIVFKKPAFDLKEGTFYDKIEGYTIYVEKKTNEGKTLNNVVIFENTNNSKYRNLVLAKKGTLEILYDTSKKKFLLFTLKDGSFFKEDVDGARSTNNFIETEFKVFEKNMDINSFKFIENSEDKASKDHMTMNLKELDSAINHELSQSAYSYNNNTLLLEDNFGIISTALKNINKTITTIDTNIYYKLKDSLTLNSTNEIIKNKFQAIENRIQYINDKMSDFNMPINRLKISWHKKLTLSVCCFLFFLIGGSLGCITKKGGVGIPLIIAVMFFIFYFFLSSSFEKSSKVSEVNVALGMWLSNIILFPIAIFLSYKALNDSPIFEKLYYLKFFKKIIRIFDRIGKKWET